MAEDWQPELHDRVEIRSVYAPGLWRPGTVIGLDDAEALVKLDGGADEDEWVNTDAASCAIRPIPPTTEGD